MSALAFELPPPLEAHEPPEARGRRRDDVRLLVATKHDGQIAHARFPDLPSFLTPGDLVVVNVSATLPAALSAVREDGTRVTVHFSTPAPAGEDDHWFVELRRDGSPFAGVRSGERLDLAGGGRATLLAPYAGGRRLWLAWLDVPGSVEAYLARYGRPIRYRHVDRTWPLAVYQNVYALEPGSAEMPSAGRPFTAELITDLVARGILVAPLTLHTGVSSPERHEPPYAERYRVPAETARLVNAVHGWGGRVIAVGTTVVRALETAAEPTGTIAPGEGWTNLIVTSERGLWTVDGVLSGWHEADASHLQLLQATAGEELLERCYREALERGYLWHEFGDSHLILP